MYLFLVCCETLSLKRPCSGSKVRQFWRQFHWGGGEGLWWLKYFYFSFAFFNFIVLQITQYNIYVLYALINVIFMKKNYSLQNLPPPPLFPNSLWRMRGGRMTHRLSSTHNDTASLSDCGTLNFRRKKVICLLSNEGNIYSQIWKHGKIDNTLD